MVCVITDMNDIYFLFSFKKMEYPYSSVDELFEPMVVFGVEDSICNLGRACWAVIWVVFNYLMSLIFMKMINDLTSIKYSYFFVIQLIFLFAITKDS